MRPEEFFTGDMWLIKSPLSQVPKCFLLWPFFKVGGSEALCHLWWVSSQSAWVRGLVSSKSQWGPEAQNLPLNSEFLLFIAFLTYNFPKSVRARALMAPTLTRPLSVKIPGLWFRYAKFSGCFGFVRLLIKSFSFNFLISCLWSFWIAINTTFWLEFFFSW